MTAGWTHPPAEPCVFCASLAELADTRVRVLDCPRDECPASGIGRRDRLAGPRPILLDLFCGAGGAAAGYIAAGFDVVGVDLAEQRRYPGRFVRADVLELTAADVLEHIGATAVHASPPCQRFSPLAAYDRSKIDGKYPDLIATTRALLERTGLPYVIENVPGAPLLEPVTLCGAAFGLRVYRHRLFEARGFALEQPRHRPHVALCSRNGNLPTAARPNMTISGGKHSAAWQRAAAEAMGMGWAAAPAGATNERVQVGIREVCEAIPPAYAEHVGRALMASLGAAAEGVAR